MKAKPPKSCFRLDEGDFRDLVSGRSVRLTARDGTRIKLRLSDIGWDRMLDAIASAMKQHAPPRFPCDHGRPEQHDPEDDDD